MIMIFDGNNAVFSYDLPYSTVREIEHIDVTYPIVTNMKSAAPNYDVVAGYYRDLCVTKIGVSQANEKWGVAGFGSNSTVPEDSLTAKMNSGVNTMLKGVGRFATCYGMGNPLESVAFKTQQTKGRLTTVMWRNFGGKFHGVVLFKDERRDWKILDAR